MSAQAHFSSLFQIQNFHQSMSDMSAYSLIILCTQQLKTIFFCFTTNYCIISFVSSSGILIFFRKLSLHALVFLFLIFSFFGIIFCLFCSSSSVNPFHTGTDQASWPSPMNWNWLEARQESQLRLYQDSWATGYRRELKQVTSLLACSPRWRGRVLPYLG